MNAGREPEVTQDEHAFVVPCVRLEMRAPLRWLRAGWSDMRRSPTLTAIFGTVIVVVSVLIALLAWKLGRFALLATLLSGFVFVAPLICVGLYCVSRALERGETPRLADSFAARLAYARHGFEQVGTRAYRVGDVVHDDVVMLRRFDRGPEPVAVAVSFRVQSSCSVTSGCGVSSVSNRVEKASTATCS